MSSMNRIIDPENHSPTPPTAQRRLAVLEDVIERGLATFIEVGEALTEIRESRLYRFDHATFEDYCRTRWGFTRRRANQLMTAAEIGTMVPVSSERVARELVPVLRDQGPDGVRNVWARVTEDDATPTAAVVRAAVDGRDVEDTNYTFVHPSRGPLAELYAILDAIGQLETAGDAKWYAEAVSVRRRVSTKRLLRQRGTFLGRIAWILEGYETKTGAGADR